jgi:hypothetical protein
MIKVDGFYLYTVGYSIHPLFELQTNAPFDEWLLPVYVAKDAVDGLLNSSVYDLRVCRTAGIKLLKVLTDLASDPQRTNAITPYERYLVVSTLSEFEHVLAAEFGTKSIWLVRQKRGYDTNLLVDSGWALFPDDLHKKVPEAIPDIMSATQCIAFTLWTAAAFHLHRANESVLRRYYDVVTNGEPRPENRNIGEYLRIMKEKGVGDTKVLSALKDLKDLHRNPLIHPEESLTTIDEANALLGAVQATIVPMLGAIPEAEQETLRLEASAS